MLRHIRKVGGEFWGVVSRYFCAGPASIWERCVAWATAPPDWLR